LGEMEMAYRGELLFLEFMVLLVIVYQLYRVEAQLVSLNSKPNFMGSSTLNPLFSEQEIKSYMALPNKWEEKAWNQGHYIKKIEIEEILNHHNSGKDKSDFKPSSKLEEAILKGNLYSIGICRTKTILREMIEANIAILNGKPISLVAEEFNINNKEQDGRIDWRDTGLEYYGMSVYLNQNIKRQCEDYLFERINLCQSNWDIYIREAIQVKGDI
jgi:hypothetical protein